MALPGDLNTTVITGTYLDASGAPLAGSITFTPSAQLADSTGSTVIPSYGKTYQLSAAGHFQTDPLAATDNADILPAGWTYQVTLAIQNLQPITFNTLVPHTPSPVDISALTPTAAATAIAAVSNLVQTPVKTANYTAAPGDLVRCSTSGGSFTVTLPTAPANGTMIGVKQVAVAGVGTNAVTVACGGSDVFNASGGSTSATLTLKGQSQLLEYASGIWEVVATDDGATALANSRQGVWYLDSFMGTDDAKMAAALSALFTAGGGSIVLSPRAHTFASQWATTYSAGVATALRIQGAGVGYNGAWGTPTAATTCAFTYSGGGTACIDMQHIGTIEIIGCKISNANTGIALFQTTNATPNLHDNVWSGGGTGVSCTTDAIYLGGVTAATGAGDTAKYNGYQGGVYRNFFDGIRRIVMFQGSSNSIQVHENTVSTSCGSGLYLGGCVEFNDTANNTTGNQVWGNCIEISNYPVGVRCTSGATMNTLGPNGFYDSTATTVCCYYFAPASGNSFNNVLDGFRTDTVPLMLDASGSNGNTAATFHQSQVSTLVQPTLNVTEGNNIFLNVLGGPLASDLKGNLVTWTALSDAPPTWSSAQVQTTSCTTVTDGSVTNASPWITSLTAAFSSADVSRAIAGTGIVSRSVITLASTPTTALKWFASNPQSLGDIGRPTISNAHLYQVTTAGTTGSTQPTWPTSGGTVTDGSVVWTDLGTSATAVLISKPATATNTGVTLSFGRAGTSVQMTKFIRHHIITTGTAPTGSATAGAGTSPTGISTAGTDHAFTFNITTGTSTATGTMFQVVPGQTWTGTPKFAMTAGNSAAATLMAGGYWLTVSSGTVTANFSNAPSASTAYVFTCVAMV